MIEHFEIYTDVLVLGSGPAGFAAAYSAAKNGAKVILVEQSGDVGGISTSGLMSHWTGSCGSPLYYEILKRTAENNEGNFKGKITNLIDPEKLKTLYLEMLCEVHCKVMLYTFAADAICDGDKILGATVINKSGKTDIFAKKGLKKQTRCAIINTDDARMHLERVVMLWQFGSAFLDMEILAAAWNAPLPRTRI